MDRTVYLLGGLLFAAMIGAYFSWTHEESADDQEQDTAVVWNIKPESVKSFHYKSDDFETTLNAKEDGVGRYLWVETTRTIKVQPKPNPTSGDDAPPIPPEPETKVVQSTFKASDITGKDLVKAFAPFVVRRDLGKVSEDRLEEFGLSGEKAKVATLTIEADKKREFEVAESGYGKRNTYLRDVDSGEVFAVRSRVMKPFVNADKQLPERRLIPFEPSEIKAVEVALPANEPVRLTHQNPLDRESEAWLIDGEASDVARAWLENKFFPVESVKYVEDPQGVEAVLKLVVYPNDGEPIEVQFYRGDKKQYAKSGFTRGFVELAKTAATDAAEDFAQVRDGL